MGCSRRPRSEARCQPGCARQRGTRAVVYPHTLQMLALAKALNESLQAPLWRTLEQRLDAFLKTFTLNFSTPHEFVAQKVLFPAHLIGGKEQRHHGDANDQGQDDFHSRAHQYPHSVDAHRNAARGGAPAAPTQSKLYVTGSSNTTK